MLSSVSYVSSGMCAGMWVISAGIYLGVLVSSFISVLLFQSSGHFCLFLTFYYVCVCSLCFYFADVFSSKCRRTFGLRWFSRDLVFYNPFQVVFRMLRWLAEFPVLTPSFFLLTIAGGFGHENMAWQFFLLPPFYVAIYLCHLMTEAKIAPPPGVGSS